MRSESETFRCTGKGFLDDALWQHVCLCNLCIKLRTGNAKASMSKKVNKLSQTCCKKFEISELRDEYCSHSVVTGSKGHTHKEIQKGFKSVLVPDCLVPCARVK